MKKLQKMHLDGTDQLELKRMAKKVSFQFDLSVFMVSKLFIRALASLVAKKIIFVKFLKSFPVIVLFSHN